jgi:hypothetical protein
MMLFDPLKHNTHSILSFVFSCCSHISREFGQTLLFGIRFSSETRIITTAASHHQKHALLNKIENATSESDRSFLKSFSEKYKFTSTLLPIKSVGVQVCVCHFLCVCVFSLSLTLHAL